jgi:glycosyltransferase involved in cell wall biosynthesis
MLGVNGTILDAGRYDGFSRVTYEIIGQLCRRMPGQLVFTNVPEFKQFHKTFSVPVLFSKSSFIGHVARFLWHQTLLPQAIKRHKLRLYYSPIPDGMLWPACNQITTVYDLSPLRFPESSPRFKHYYRTIIPRLLDVSACTIAGSHSTKRELERIFPNRGKIEVIYPGYKKNVFFHQPQTEINRIRMKYGLGTYLLCVSEIRPYKNTRKMIEAYTSLSNPSASLVIVGRPTKLELDIAHFAVKVNNDGNIRFLGHVPDKDLAALYSGAQAFVFPSYYEGFGLPPLEAMACGCPVLASNTSSIPEVCGKAAHYFDPYSVQSMADAMNTVLGDRNLRENLSEKGLEQASIFSFDKTVDELTVLFNRFIDTA